MQNLIGSPPHTWRKPTFFSALWQGIGITSTYVEKTKVKTYFAQKNQDHLHIRGEN